MSISINIKPFSPTRKPRSDGQVRVKWLCYLNGLSATYKADLSPTNSLRYPAQIEQYQQVISRQQRIGGLLEEAGRGGLAPALCKKRGMHPFHAVGRGPKLCPVANS